VSPRRSISLLFVLLLGAFVPSRLHAQGDADIIRGRVVGPDKKPVENVTVTATSLVNQTSRTAKTNKDGRFSIIFNGGGGDYMMAYISIGFAPARFEVKREVDEDILIADATMSKTAVSLDAVRVTAGRERPDRNGNSLDVGGRDQAVNTNNVPIDILGDLSAMAATLPGVTLIPGADGAANGFSVLGLGADQNNITLNGLNFAGTDLPRDATTQQRVTTSSFDPSRGGFSGAQISLRTNSGNNYETRSLHQTVDSPSLQYTDAVGRALGQQFTNLQLSGSAAGPFVLDKAFYALSWQLGRRTSNLQDLLNLSSDALALERVGVSPDSVQHLVQLLNQAQIPLTNDAIPSSKLTQNGSFLSSFDFAPSGGHFYNITMNGRWQGQDGANLSSTAVPDHGGDTRSYGGTLQGRHSAYFKDNFLDNTSGAIQESVTQGSPYIELPSATVRVNSTFPDGTAGISNLQFGGNTSLPRNSHTLNSELQNELSWISLDNKHRYKFGLDFRYNRYSQDNTTNRFGTYTYNSIQDFQDGVPASFSRRLQVNQRFGDDVGGSAWLGDAWRATQRFQVTYGLRVDASHFQGNPQFNPVIDSVYQQRNDAVPRGIYVSPRLGFSWTYGTNPQIGGFQGAQRGSRGQISGGIGQFQNLPSSPLIAAAVDQTGLPSAAQQLSCIGSAVPSPDWLQYLTNTGMIPTTCTGDVSSFTSTVPNVTLFSKDYIPQRSWRANLNWNAPILNNMFRLTSGATYSLNLNQQSQIDLNFNQKPVFTLSNEGRPVFVDPTLIFPATGTTIENGSRVSTEFANVTDYLSDLRSHTTQLSVGISPVTFNSAFQWSVTYVWQKILDEQRGFAGGSTASDPYLVQWARGNQDARHQITYNVGYTFHQAVSVVALGRIQSGNPFTPMVSGDINGDGYNNDRAFIYDPSKVAADSALSAGMHSLLTGAPSSVKSCLEKQLGTIAGRNSCQGPWYTTLSLRVSLVSQAMKVVPDRATISLGIANPLTGLDALIHGSNNLHGWGAPSFADPTLLFVHGFDPATQQYQYTVNPRFGANRQATATLLAPTQLTLDVRVDVGPERERQDLFLRLRSGRGGRGNKLSADQIKIQYERTYPNPFEQMLRQQDSLGLSNETADSIAILNKSYGKIIDSIWTPVAAYLASLEEKYDLDEAYDRVRTAENKSLDQMAIYGPAAKQLLTPEQVRKLPPFIALFLDNQAIRQVRPGRAGGGRGGFFGG
jgi:hypothetical protein